MSQFRHNGTEVRVCGLGFDGGPVRWGVTITELESMVGVFDGFFGDLVKSLFKDTLARAFIAAFDRVRDSVTALAEEAIELFRAARAATAEIARTSTAPSAAPPMK